MIVFSIDVDWAPDEVIKDTLELFEKNNIKCTIFSTHYTRVLETCNMDLFELAIHPNFNDLLDGNSKVESASNIIDNLLKIYPNAKGIRSHSMTQSSRLLSLFKSKGLIYDSNQFFPYNYSINAYRCWTGLKRIPYNWEDDVHFAYNHSFEFNFPKIYESDKNFIFDFHPVHIYLNTDCQKTYDQAKRHYHDVDMLKSHRNRHVLGVRDYLLELFEFIQLNKLETKKMIEINV